MALIFFFFFFFLLPAIRVPISITKPLLCFDALGSHIAHILSNSYKASNFVGESVLSSVLDFECGLTPH